MLEQNPDRLLFTTQLLHDIKDFLSVIYGSAVLIEEESDCPTARPHLEVILRNSDLLNRLLDDVLALHQAELGQLSVRPTWVDLRRELEALLQPHRQRARQKGLDLLLLLPLQVPDEVEIDSLRLTQILSNLVSNAVKFTLKGEVRVEVEYAGDRLKFQVIDTGPGIAPEEVEEIFEPYRRRGQNLLREEGHGLGLALARRLARLLEGDLVWQKPPEGKPGCVFTVTLRAPARSV